MGLYFHSTKASGILPNILGQIGHTPLVRLNKIPKEFGLKCDVREYSRTHASVKSLKSMCAASLMEHAA